MTKKRSKCLFILFTIILVLCLIACFVNFTYPLSVKGNYYSYSNFVTNLRLGDDVGSSLKIVYRANLEDLESSTNFYELRVSTGKQLKKIAQDQGFTDVTVNLTGDDCLSVSIGNILTDKERDGLVNLIGNPKSISFSTSSTAGENVFARREAIKDVYSTSVADGGKINYYIVVTFKDECSDLMINTSKDNQIYIFLGENQFGSIEKGGITQNYIGFSNDSVNTMDDATTIANQIKAGMLDLSLTQISCDTISASLGYHAEIYVAIVALVAVIALFAFLIVRYNTLGLLACYNLLFFIVLGLFFIQSIPLTHVNYGGFIGMFVGLLLAVDSMLIIFEKTRQYYMQDSKLYIAFKASQKASLFRILFLSAVSLIAGFVCLFIPSLAVKSFGWTIFVLSFVSLFVNLVLLRLFIKMYLAFNNTNGAKCNFNKGGKNV